MKGITGGLLRDAYAARNKGIARRDRIDLARGGPPGAIGQSVNWSGVRGQVGLGKYGRLDRSGRGGSCRCSQSFHAGDMKVEAAAMPDPAPAGAGGEHLRKYSGL
jgi:hypothetical protein